MYAYIFYNRINKRSFFKFFKYMPLKKTNKKNEKKGVTSKKKNTVTKENNKKKASVKSSPRKTTKKAFNKKTSPLKKSVSKKTPQEKLIGKVVHYFGKAKVAVVKLKAPLALDEKIRIKGGETDFQQKVKSMEIDKKKIKKAKARQEVGMKVNKKVREGYKVFKLS